MAHFEEKDQDRKAPDDVAATIAPTDGDRRDDAGLGTPLREDTESPDRYDEKITEVPADDADEESSDGRDREEKRPGLQATKSYATDASVATSTGPVAKEQRPWYKKTNPLRWGGIPDVPSERSVSREAKAGFLSKLTFTWMGPLMTVRCRWRAPPCPCFVFFCRISCSRAGRQSPPIRRSAGFDRAS